MDDDAFWPRSANSPKTLDNIYKQPGNSLNRLRPCIRVLELHPGAVDDPVECTLRAACLDDKDVEYEAVSYAWGDASITSTVWVNGEEFHATVNLKDFLQCLRLPDRRRLLWADAICIDQSSFEEKISHLGLMGRIYREAKQVHVWLGHFTSSWVDEIVRDKAESAMWAKKMAESRWPGMDVHLRRSLHKSFSKANMPLPAAAAEYEDILDGESPLGQLTLLLDALADDAHLFDLPFYSVSEDRLMTPCTEADIDEDETKTEAVEYNMEWLMAVRVLLWACSRPWWTRVWTLQELLLPRADPIMHIDSWSLPASRFLDALANVVKHQKACCKEFKTIWPGEYAETAEELVKRVGYLKGMREEAQTNEGSGMNFLDVVIESSQRQATDMRDYIYGIVALFDPGFFMISLHKAYRQTTVELYIQTLKLICSHGLLELLSFSSGPRASRLPGLPSWAIDFSHASSDSHPFSMAYPETKTGLEKHPYNGKVCMTDLWEPTLPVQGIRVGTIGSCAKIIPKCFGDGDLSIRQIRALVEEALDVFYTANEDTSSYDEDRFWRTVFQRFAHEEPDAPAGLSFMKDWWKDFCAFEPPKSNKRKRESVPDASDVLQLQIEDDFTNSPSKMLGVHTFVANSALALWKQGRFFCTEKGHPGIGSSDIEPSDEVYMLASFRGLVILRRLPQSDSSESSGGSGDGQSGGKPAFTFRGTCYMDGYMQGEGVQGDLVLEDLVLH